MLHFACDTDILIPEIISQTSPKNFFIVLHVIKTTHNNTAKSQYKQIINNKNKQENLIL